MLQNNTETQRIVQHGQGGELFMIFIVNLILTILTLGIYRFWAITRTRRYIWSHTRIEGHTLEYTGQGLELLIGFLKVFVIFVALGIGIAFFPPLLALLYLAMPFLMGLAIYGAMRYRLSHTRLRGVRFGLDGKASDYALMVLGYTLLLFFTLGMAAPWVRSALYGELINHMRFGSARFTYDGRGAQMAGPFFLAVLLTIPTVGLIWLWYRGREIRYQTRHTRLDQVQFGSHLSGGAYFWLVLSNLLLLLFTLGLALPWVALRSIRFMLDRLELDGELDYASIEQSAAEANATGEGLADALDVGVF